MKTNVILHGDCRERLSDVPTESVDLIYLDPPFFSNKKYEEEMNDGTEEMRASFEDRWAGGVDKFIEWMRPALSECHRVLKETGSIYLHCDWHADSELDVLMKEIFGRENLRNKIVWSYNAGLGHAKQQFIRRHNTILFYSKTQKNNFNIQRREYQSRAREGKKAVFGGYNGVGKGEVIHYHPDGTIVDDVWKVSPIMPNAKENIHYPTQKPEKLLDRIIKASSNEGGFVLDPFMGSGTTLAVAAKLGRQFLGIDVSTKACRIAKERLGNIDVLENQKIEVEYKHEPVLYLKDMNAFNFERWVCDRLEARHIGKTKDRDGEMPDGTPIEVKTWKEAEKVGRRYIQRLAGVAIKAPTKKGIFVGWDFTKEAVMEVAEQRKAGIEIELVKVENLRKQ